MQMFTFHIEVDYKSTKLQHYRTTEFFGLNMMGPEGRKFVMARTNQALLTKPFTY